MPTLTLGVLLFGTGTLTYSQSSPAANPIPVIDGNAGPCSVEFRVTNTKGAPVYNAKVAVRVAYGFTGMRKLDLEVGTNSDGRARFTGLPNKVKAGTLLFRATQGNLSGTTYYNPTTNCNAHQDIVVSTESE